jgi:branched-chain amino acid transport system permease protein
MGGMMSLCHAAFYGIGAYTGTLLMVNLGWSFFPAMILAVFGTAFLSLIISIPSLRIKGDYFVLGSLGFQSIVYIILYNWIDVTRGPYGISGIPMPSLFGFTIKGLEAWFWFSTILMGICVLLISLVMHSPFGRTLKAIRDDEIATGSLGKNVSWFKIRTFALAAGFAAVAGMLFSGYMRYIDPTSFTIMESVFILSIIIIGGAGNLQGPIIGAVGLVILPELLRFIGMPDAIAANMRQIIYGLVIILLIRWRPQGLLGEYKFS